MYNNRSKYLNYSLCIQSVSPNQLFARPRNELSYLYWGWSTVSPFPNDTAIQNVAVLLDGMWSVELNDFDAILALPNLWDNQSQHYELHDFRKIIRSAVFAISYFPQVY